jgi:hypothetical protein
VLPVAPTASRAQHLGHAHPLTPDRQPTAALERHGAQGPHPGRGDGALRPALAQPMIATATALAAHEAERIAIGGDWLLWRDLAVRSAGFPVDGLAAFGAGDESARLSEVARDPSLREAMTWQNPAAVVNALDRVAEGAGVSTSKSRRREDVVASYWQRYCAKNDTIGFYGPLAWGRIADAPAPPLHARSGDLIRERSVHLESWGVQTLAASLDPELRVALGPRSEDDLRRLLEDHPDPGLRARGLAALAALEAARDALARADGAQLPAALAALDAEFVRLTGVAPTRHHGRAYGARSTSARPRTRRAAPVRRRRRSPGRA